jgi:predicted tellurium resistance membrane protein TerC
VGVITQIAFVDIIFSLDSVITTVGMADHLWVMVAAIMIAMALRSRRPTRSEFVSRHRR